MELKGIENERRRLDMGNIYGPKSFHNGNMLTLSIEGKLWNRLRYMKINDLKISISWSTYEIQFEIVICRKDKGGRVVKHGNRELSQQEYRRHIMNHTGWRDENCFYCKRCRIDMNTKKYKSTLHVELGHWFILLNWKTKAKNCAEVANSHGVLWPLFNTLGRPFVPIGDI